MSIKSRMINIKDHVKEHKLTYALVSGVGITCFIAGAIVSKQPPINVTPDIMNKIVNVLAWKPSNTFITTLERRGHPGNIVECIETGMKFASQAQAAEMMRLSKSALSQHLNGLRDSVGGHTFRVLREAV